MPLLLYILELTFLKSLFANQIITEVAYLIKVKGSAYGDIKDKIKFCSIPPLSKLGKLILYDQEEQEMHSKMMRICHWPTAETGSM